MLRILFSLSMGFIFLSSLAQADEPNTEVAATESQPIAEQDQRLPLRELRLFTQVFEQIRQGYVEEVSDTQLLENAIAGLLTELDPHSVYLNEESYGDLEENSSGEYGGLGLEVATQDGVIRVVSPIDDSPAAEAGIEAGDLIIKMNDNPVRGMSLQKAIEKMRGEQGTSIKLTVYREGEDDTMDIDVVRDIIQVSAVRNRLLESGYGYVRIAQFQRKSGSDFVDALQELKQQSEQENPLKGLVIDLRNNPGGLVPASVEIADALIDSGTIVYTEGRLPSSNQSFDATPGDMLEGLPVVVLINGGSASASEIVAGALQDHGRAAILGTQSFGKGSVQTVVPLGDGRAVKLTTARYFTPNGRSIQAEGIVPDITVERAEIRPYNFRQRVREADLEGHLETMDEDSKPADTDDDGESKEDLSADNQLYEAVNLLKGFYLLGAKP
ncbi:S41 family peptidase [Porticoccaceae bacterium]|nr:S41 family peptidase [Porticoccaceae bacterium]